MADVLRMPWDELITTVEAAAARADGGSRAANVLRALLEHEAAGGDTGDVIPRLLCKPHIDDRSPRAPQRRRPRNG